MVTEFFKLLDMAYGRHVCGLTNLREVVSRMKSEAISHWLISLVVGEDEPGNPHG